MLRPAEINEDEFDKECLRYSRFLSESRLIMNLGDFMFGFNFALRMTDTKLRIIRCNTTGAVKTNHTEHKIMLK